MLFLIKNIRVLLLYVLIIIFCFNLSAIDPQIPLKQCILDEWNIVNGVSNESVNSITQSNNGLLWMATFNGGIVTFDGINFEGVDLGRLFFENTFKVYTDKDDQVWIGRTPGLICYQPDTGEYKLIRNKENGYSIASCIMEDHNNNLWIGTEASSLFRLKNGKSESYLSEEDRKNFPFITSVFLDSYSNLWITAHNKGLFNVTNRKCVKRDVKQLGPDTVFYAITEDNNNRLIVGTDQGLLVFDADNKETLITQKDGLVNNSVNCLLTDSDGNIFVGTQKGLSRIHFGPDGEFDIDNILNDNCINCLYEGKEGSLWIGTASSGLKRLRKPVLKIYSINEGLPNLNLSIYKDKGNNIWVGTQYGTLYRYINK